MKTDRQVALALVKVSLQVRKHADSREGNPLRAPAESPVCSEDLYDPHYVFIVVKRLAHTHEDCICKLV